MKTLVHINSLIESLARELQSDFRGGLLLGNPLWPADCIVLSRKGKDYRAKASLQSGPSDDPFLEIWTQKNVDRGDGISCADLVSLGGIDQNSVQWTGAPHCAHGSCFNLVSMYTIERFCQWKVIKQSLTKIVCSLLAWRASKFIHTRHSSCQMNKPIDLHSTYSHLEDVLYEFLFDLYVLLPVRFVLVLLAQQQIRDVITHWSL